MGSIQYSQSLDYEIVAPDGTTIFPKDNNRGKKACWRWSKKKFEWGKSNGFIEINKDKEGVWTVYTKQYLNCDNEGSPIDRTKRPSAFIDGDIINRFSSTQAAKSLDKLDLVKMFDYTKPIAFMQNLIERVIDKGDLILDFFAGSSSTAHAVMQLNAEDGGNRKFIMVQIPEKTDEKSEAYKAGYKTISEIGKERIRRAGEKIKEDNIDKEGIEDLDIGFRVLKVDSSNMKDVYFNPDETKQDDILDLADNIKDDRTSEDLLFMVLLNWGIELSAKIERKKIAGKEVFFVDNNFLAACFEEEIDENFIKALVDEKPRKVVLKDSSFANSSVKINVEQIFVQANIEGKVI